MLLAIDIGNTSIAFGVFEGEELHFTTRIATDIQRMPEEYAILILNLLHYHGVKQADVDEVVLCSVVPPLILTFEELLEDHLKIKPLVIEAGVKTGVKIRMDNPREVGADRIVNAAAAHHLYGGPVIIADLGTATTFDTVTREGDYIGGAISPGISTSAESLFIKAAMLPRLELIAPKRVIGTNTIAAMQSGIVFGYVALVEGMVSRIQKEFGEKMLVVATGGYAKLIARETTIIDVLNPDLTLIGLRIIYSMNKG